MSAENCSRGDDFASGILGGDMELVDDVRPRDGGADSWLGRMQDIFIKVVLAGLEVRLNISAMEATNF